MKTFYYTEEELNNLTLYHSGSESNIYQKDNLLITRYNELCENTLKKIAYFNKFNLYFTTYPIALLKVEKKYSGYVMEIKDNFITIDNYKNLPIEQKYQLLVKLKYYLIELHKLGFIYGDLNPKNIISDGKNIYLTDIVNSKYDKNDFTTYSKNMIKYKRKIGKIDYNIDNYMLNLFTIYFLNDIEYDNILDNIINSIDDYFNNKEPNEIIGVTDNFRCLNIASKMYNPHKGINELLIDNIDIKKYNEKTKTLTKRLD